MDQETLEKIMAMTVAEGTLPGRMGIKILSASASRVVATMPAEGNIQPHALTGRDLAGAKPPTRRLPSFGRRSAAMSAT